MDDSSRAMDKIDKKERYRRAVQAVTDGQPIMQAAAAYSISQQSLRRRLSGEVQIEARNGPDTILSREEEQAVVDATIHMANAGIGLTVTELKAKIMDIVSDGRLLPSSWEENGPGRAWVEGFFSRHKSALSLRSSRIYDSNRRAADDEEALRGYFGRVKVVIDEHGFGPAKIWNLDETGEYSISACPLSARHEPKLDGQ